MTEHGKGGVQSPPDERDWLYQGEHLAGAGSTLPAFRLGNRPPVTDQMLTPECVAYSTAVEQNWQDRVEHGHFFKFWEHLFFERIGGNASGAHMRSALDELLNVGYPEAAPLPGAADHRCASYVLIAKSVSAVKAAIVNFGGVLCVGPWFDNWTDGLGSLAVLPRPSGGGTGHAWWGIGWDEFGMLCQNSWGTAWGDGGLFRMPWAYVVGNVWEIWGTLDQDTTAKLQRKFVVNGPGINIRFTTPEPGEHANIFAQSKPSGIFRNDTGNRIGPLSYEFTFLHWHRSADGSQWAVGRGFRRRLAVRKSLMHFKPAAH